MLRQIPTTIVLCLALIVIASWPTVQVWAEGSSVHHFLAHGLYLLAGGLFGLQTAWWAHSASVVTHTDDTGVSS
jgi:hypothetical protein